MTRLIWDLVDAPEFGEDPCNEDPKWKYGIPDKYKLENMLDGFEKVLGRKFTCDDCDNKYGIGCWYPSINRCENWFKLSDETKAEIKLKDNEIEITKIDTHPRYIINIPIHNTNNSMCRHEILQLELIL